MIEEIIPTEAYVPKSTRLGYYTVSATGLRQIADELERIHGSGDVIIEVMEFIYDDTKTIGFEIKDV